MTNATVIKMPGLSALPESTPKKERSVMDTVLITPDGTSKWKLPSFQRPLKQTPKLLEVAEQIKADGGVIPGILTIGILKGDKYLIDGQHRVEAFRISGCKEGIADVRFCYFSSMAEMGQEFVTLNGSIVRMAPDDILRGLEESVPVLGIIRKRCPFIAYGNVRRSGRTGGMVGMSVAIRCWLGSAPEIPKGPNVPAREVAQRLPVDEVDMMCTFFNTVHSAWGDDLENGRLWGGLNLTVLAWLWRRTIMMRPSFKATKITQDHFRLGCLALSADHNYTDWLVARNMNERDRAPCFQRMKTVFVRRLSDEMKTRVQIIQPSWAGR